MSPNRASNKERPGILITGQEESLYRGPGESANRVLTVGSIVPMCVKGFRSLGLAPMNAQSTRALDPHWGMNSTVSRSKPDRMRDLRGEAAGIGRFE